MPIRYSLNQLPNPAKRSEPQKYYAIASDSEAVNTQQIASYIEKTTALSEADVKAAISAISNFIIDNLLDGKSINLDELGTFYTTLHSKGVLEKGAFSVDMIEGAKARFLPSKKLKERLKQAEYKKSGIIEVATPAPKPKQ